MAHGGDKAAREKLIVENMGLIWSIVKRFAGVAMNRKIYSR